MNSVIKGLVAGCLALILCPACGGSSNDSSAFCSNSSACGGDITGTWSVASSCLSVTGMSAMNSQCANATFDESALKVTGTITYNADLTFTSTSTVSGSSSVTWPASCLTTQGVTVSCDQLAQAFTKLAQQPDPKFKSASCSSAGSGCTCNMVLNDQTTTQTGTYSTTAGGLLTETPSTGSVDESNYCVKGNQLTLSPGPGSNMGTTGLSVSGAVVFSKQ